jgi:hypothetical protein
MQVCSALCQIFKEFCELVSEIFGFKVRATAPTSIKSITGLHKLEETDYNWP